MLSIDSTENKPKHSVQCPKKSVCLSHIDLCKWSSMTNVNYRMLCANWFCWHLLLALGLPPMAFLGARVRVLQVSRTETTVTTGLRYLRFSKGIWLGGSDQIVFAKWSQTSAINHADVLLFWRWVGTKPEKKECLFRSKVFPFSSEVMRWPLRSLHRQSYTVHSVSQIECMP